MKLLEMRPEFLDRGVKDIGKLAKGVNSQNRLINNALKPRRRKRADDAVRESEAVLVRRTGTTGIARRGIVRKNVSANGSDGTRRPLRN